MDPAYDLWVGGEMVHDTGDVQRAARLTQIKTFVLGFYQVVLNRIYHIWALIRKSSLNLSSIYRFWFYKYFFKSEEKMLSKG